MYFEHFLHIFAAMLPGVVILIYVYKQDVFPEPKQIVFKTFLFGCATILGIDLVIPVLDNFSEANFKGETYYFFDSFIRAGFVEEIFKAMVLVFYCTRKSAFDEPMDGIIYGVAVSLGYAAYENIAYILINIKPVSLTAQTENWLCKEGIPAVFPMSKPSASSLSQNKVTWKRNVDSRMCQTGHDVVTCLILLINISRCLFNTLQIV